MDRNATVAWHARGRRFDPAWLRQPDKPAIQPAAIREPGDDAFRVGLCPPWDSSRRVLLIIYNKRNHDCTESRVVLMHN